MTETHADALLQKLVALAEDKKAQNIVSLKLQGITVICDFFLIVSASNTKQAQAISDHIEETMKHEGEPPLRIEGYRDGRWILLDFGSVVVHIFLDEEREYYNLERLWGDAEKKEH